jgi:hypothetical protein
MSKAGKPELMGVVAAHLRKMGITWAYRLSLFNVASRVGMVVCPNWLYSIKKKAFRGSFIRELIWLP